MCSATRSIRGRVSSSVKSSDALIPGQRRALVVLQLALGFLLTNVTLWGVPLVAEHVGWGWAFFALSCGPLWGIQAMRRLKPLRAL